VNRVVFDASVVAKWLFREPGSDEAVSLLNKADIVYEPDLFSIEIDAIISKKKRIKEISQDEAKTKRSLLSKFQFHSVSYKEVSDLAFELSVSLPLTLYDAFYLATAMVTNSVLYTADERLVRALSTTKLNEFISGIYSSEEC
tara:strand:- start:291993 stop:292421 length:429 start_codon:yes stop_codon:yes gene_type:complete